MNRHRPPINTAFKHRPQQRQQSNPQPNTKISRRHLTINVNRRHHNTITRSRFTIISSNSLITRLLNFLRMVNNRSSHRTLHIRNTRVIPRRLTRNSIRTDNQFVRSRSTQTISRHLHRRGPPLRPTKRLTNVTFNLHNRPSRHRSLIHPTITKNRTMRTHLRLRTNTQNRRQISIRFLQRRTSNNTQLTQVRILIVTPSFRPTNHLIRRANRSISSHKLTHPIQTRRPRSNTTQSNRISTLRHNLKQGLTQNHVNLLRPNRTSHNVKRNTK